MGRGVQAKGSMFCESHPRANGHYNGTLVMQWDQAAASASILVQGNPKIQALLLQASACNSISCSTRPVQPRCHMFS